jgi:hypothetical protein
MVELGRESGGSDDSPGSDEARLFVLTDGVPVADDPSLDGSTTGGRGDSG